MSTKLAPWLGRGAGDVLTSLDVHDTVVLIDGRPELIDELAAQPDELRTYVAAELTSLREVDYSSTSCRAPSRLTATSRSSAP